jgi:hypothetical protein
MDKKVDQLVDSYIILNRWENCFSQLFIVYGASGVRQMELQLSLVILRLRLLLKISEGISYQVLIKCWQN